MLRQSMFPAGGACRVEAQAGAKLDNSLAVNCGGFLYAPSVLSQLAENSAWTGPK